MYPVLFKCWLNDRVDYNNQTPLVWVYTADSVISVGMFSKVKYSNHAQSQTKMMVNVLIFQTLNSIFLGLNFVFMQLFFCNT